MTLTPTRRLVACLAITTLGAVVPTGGQAVPPGNSTPKLFSWSVKAAPEWNLSSMRALSVAISVGDVPATNVVLHHASLTGDDKLKRTLGTEHFRLCESATDPCVAPAASLPARRPHTLYIRPAGELPVGVFKGNLLVGVAEKTDPEVLSVTLYSPRPWGTVLGWMALALGVLGSLFLQVFARTWVQQRQDKLAIAMLRQRLADAIAAFKVLPDNLKAAAAAWETRANDLKKDMTELDQLTRSLIPQTFSEEVSSVETLKAALERHGKSVAQHRALLRDGLVAVAVVQRDVPTVATAAVTAAVTAAKTIASISPAEDAPTLIRAALAALRAAAGLETLPVLAAVGGPAEQMRSLRLQVTAMSFVVWVLWALIAIGTGALALIYQNPAFGTQVDLLVCLAWGLGVSVAGQQATQASPVGVAQSIGIKLPGAK